MSLARPFKAGEEITILAPVAERDGNQGATFCPGLKRPGYIQIAATRRRPSAPGPLAQASHFAPLALKLSCHTLSNRYSPLNKMNYQ